MLTKDSALYVALITGGSKSVSLHTADPTRDGDQNELVGGNYQAASCSFSGSFVESPDRVEFENISPLVFNLADDDLGDVTHLVIKTGPTTIYVMELDTPIAWVTDSQVMFDTGCIKLQLLVQ